MIEFGSVGDHGAVFRQNSVDIPYPSGIQADDILIIQVFNFASGATITDPSGWTVLYKSGVSSSHRWAYYIKRATGSESGSLTIMGGPTSLGLYGIMSRWTGVQSSGDMYDDAIETGHQNDSTAESQAITTLGADRLVIVFTSLHEDDALGAWSGSFVEDFESLDTTAYKSAFAAASQLKASAGTVAAESASWPSSDYHTCLTIALIPEAAPPPTTKNKYQMLV